ncbi:hypothetical protein SAMN05421874_128137 [Nonomuraea maritima]|uniref:Uncharacterized protein n=1 Tax=Nonomuraea maritima TaxID=683260 RepID=A0A1G9MR59_9ACTN|nr:hypothetical protein [Nonomuraea maritima]SDL76397.1 hypothetical protein SAMN05421874_128137 [Nonomuraea maritima]
MFQYNAPAGLPVDQSKTEPTEQVAPAAEVAPTSSPARRPSWVQVLEDRARMPGLRTARLPSVATVRAYHREREYVPWEAELLDLPARVHGWFAVAWCFGCTSIAFLGAGDYRRRLTKFREEGLPGLCRAQLPRLKTLSGFPRAWVAFWSAVCWPGLKFWGPITAGFYLLMISLPILLPILLSLI